MSNRKQVEWARQQRLRMLTKHKPAPVVVKPIVVPVIAPEPPVKPIIVPKVKPEPMLDHQLPYLRKRGEYICEVCGYTLKTEKGIRLHIEAKHPEVEL